MLAHTTPCDRCWSPYTSVILFGFSIALISPSVNPSIPMVTSRERLAFVFSLFRAFGATASGLFILMTGLIQEKTQKIRGGYYWVNYVANIVIEHFVVSRSGVVGDNRSDCAVLC